MSQVLTPIAGEGRVPKGGARRRAAVRQKGASAPEAPVGSNGERGASAAKAATLWLRVRRVPPFRFLTSHDSPV